MTKIYPANGTSAVGGRLPQPESLNEISDALNEAPALKAAATLRSEPAAAPAIAEVPEPDNSLLPSPSPAPRR